MISDEIGHGLASHFYFDRDDNLEAIKVLPGEYFVTHKPMVLATVLGSCVSACIRDPRAGIGGMNHFMLPGDGSRDHSGSRLRYGEAAMTTLVEEICRRGGKRQHLEAKLFGGGMVISGMASRVGQANSEFAVDWLERAGIPLLAQDLNNSYARRVHYLPATGQARLKRLQGSDNLQQREKKLLASLLDEAPPPALAADIKGALR
ncbi:hypothetical protein [Kushneria aurantia]|uniref:Probable chemoreceptor glutamine deamidase CheD n=1 Tax=Kushneria aurantia TaxID=504092 RepID=A0ABV6G1P2_9GAMM|nr:hypothetical protein [Kushneria aurantia]